MPCLGATGSPCVGADGSPARAPCTVISGGTAITVEAFVPIFVLHWPIGDPNDMVRIMHRAPGETDFNDVSIPADIANYQMPKSDIVAVARVEYSNGTCTAWETLSLDPFEQSMDFSYSQNSFYVALL